MAKIFSVVSGKGGVGRSTVCCHLARSMVEHGEKTLVVELGFGFRELDVFFNIDQIVYDFGDVVGRKCSVFDAVQNVKDCELLSLLPASVNCRSQVKNVEFKNIICDLQEKYDNIILDLPLEYDGFRDFRNFLDVFLVVVTPDPLCVRNAAMYTSFLRGEFEDDVDLKLIVNKISKKSFQRGFVDNIDSIIDETQLQFLGGLPESKNIMFANFSGTGLKKRSLEYKIFDAMYQRLIGNSVKVLI